MIAGRRSTSRQPQQRQNPQPSQSFPSFPPLGLRTEGVESEYRSDEALGALGAEQCSILAESQHLPLVWLGAVVEIIFPAPCDDFQIERRSGFRLQRQRTDVETIFRVGWPRAALERDKKATILPRLPEEVPISIVLERYEPRPVALARRR